MEKAATASDVLIIGAGLAAAAAARSGAGVVILDGRSPGGRAAAAASPARPAPMITTSLAVAAFSMPY